MSVLLRFVALYALMYAAFGVSSPFMPAFFKERGLTPEQLALLVGAGTAIRLASGPLVGRLADLTQALRTALAGCEAQAAIVAVGLLWASSFTPLLLISLVQAAALAPTTALADALALRAAQPREGRPRFEYGWVRGTGSAFFVIGTLASGQLVEDRGLASIMVFQAALLAGAAGAAMLLPKPESSPRPAVTDRAPPSGVVTLLRIPEFRRVMLVASLILGSRAMHDTFAVIRWSAAGITPAIASVLWSESVVAEVLVFFLFGPPLLARLQPAGVLIVQAAAGVVRWATMASSASVLALAVVQPLHGLTFARLHLACMRLIPAIVPQRLAATAQALYAFGADASTAFLILVSGRLYGALNERGFLVMALLCAAVPPLAWRLYADDARVSSGQR